MKTVKIVIIVSISILLLSCVRELEYKVANIQPEIVINAIVGNDSTFKIKVDLSSPLFSESSGRVMDTIDFNVELFEDGQLIEKLEVIYERYFSGGIRNYTDSIFQYEKYYVSEHIAQTGKKYMLRASYPGFETAQASHVIPKTINLIDIDTVCFYDETNGKPVTLSFLVKFDDPENEVNYYRVYYEAKYGVKVPPEHEEYDSLKNQIVVFDVQNDLLRITNSYIKSQDDANSYLFGAPYNRYNVFTDELINGQKCAVEFKTQSTWYGKLDLTKLDTLNGEFFWFKAYILQITRETYLYLESLDKIEYNGFDEFSEAVILYNNIENGVGIFGAYAADTKIISIGSYPSEKYTYIVGERFRDWY
ncbi:MAG: DUF4249 domain-containing protein [Marinilabiliaceae bacterium]|nr:DUF4249 domain-containing protein [Marinilabiliaceae bacterium]